MTDSTFKLQSLSNFMQYFWKRIHVRTLGTFILIQFFFVAKVICFSSNIKYKVYKHMKLKVTFNQKTAHIHVHRSKSKSKLKTILNQPKLTHKTEFHTHSAHYQNDCLSENNPLLINESRVQPKRSCEHKKKTQFMENSDYEYFKLSHRSRQQLQRQNEKLRKENIVLNEYCAYFQKKLAKQQKKTSQRAFSFRSEEFGRAKLLFGQLSKQTAATYSKSNSKMQRHFQ